MLKKAGIITVGVAASLVAVSPLAFAGDKGGHGHHQSGGPGVNYANAGDTNTASANGLLAIGGINALNNSPINVCAPINVPVQGNNILGILGLADAAPNLQATDCALDNSKTAFND